MNGKSLYCIKTKDIFLDFKTNKYEEYRYTTDIFSMNHFVLVFKNDLLYLTTVYKNLDKDGYTFIDNEVRKKPFEYSSNNSSINWNRQRIIGNTKKIYTYNLNRETLELIMNNPKEEGIKSFFQCKVGKKI